LCLAFVLAIAATFAFYMHRMQVRKSGKAT
jgi:hypothetical protein